MTAPQRLLLLLCLLIAEIPISNTLTCFVGTSELYSTEECLASNAVCLTLANHTDFEGYCNKKHQSWQMEVNRMCAQASEFNRWDCLSRCKLLGEFWTCCCSTDYCNKADPVCPGKGKKKQKTRTTKENYAWSTEIPHITAHITTASRLQNDEESNVLIKKKVGKLKQTTEGKPLDTTTISDPETTETATTTEQIFTTSTQEPSLETTEMEEITTSTEQLQELIYTTEPSSTEKSSSTSSTQESIDTTSSAEITQSSSSPEESTEVSTTASTTSEATTAPLTSKKVTKRHQPTTQKFKKLRKSTSPDVTKGSTAALESLDLLSVFNEEPTTRANNKTAMAAIPHWPNYVAFAILGLIFILVIVLSCIITYMITTKKRTTQAVGGDKLPPPSPLPPPPLHAYTVPLASPEYGDSSPEMPWPQIPPQFRF